MLAVALCSTISWLGCKEAAVTGGGAGTGGGAAAAAELGVPGLLIYAAIMGMLLPDDRPSEDERRRMWKALRRSFLLGQRGDGIACGTSLWWHFDKAVRLYCELMPRDYNRCDNNIVLRGFATCRDGKNFELPPIAREELGARAFDYTVYKSSHELWIVYFEFNDKDDAWTVARLVHHADNLPSEW